MKTVFKKSGAQTQNSVLATAAGLALLGGEILGIGGAVLGSVIGIVVAIWSNNHSRSEAHH